MRPIKAFTDSIKKLKLSTVSIESIDHGRIAPDLARTMAGARRRRGLGQLRARRRAAAQIAIDAHLCRPENRITAQCQSFRYPRKKGGTHAHWTAPVPARTGALRGGERHRIGRAASFRGLGSRDTDRDGSDFSEHGDVRMPGALQQREPAHAYRAH